MDSLDPRQLLARRLRALREDRWPEMKITQPQLARALGGSRPLSVPLISSWESLTNPKIPPYQRIEAYAALFATRRSLESGTLRLLNTADLTADERRVMDELKRELTRLRNNALQLTIALASAPRDTEEGHSACSPFGEHRALAAERGC